MSDDLTERLRNHKCYVGKEALAEIERLQAANTRWLQKWEALECEWCGSNSLRELEAERLRDRGISMVNFEGEKLVEAIRALEAER